jgi:hypothetical protein
MLMAHLRADGIRAGTVFVVLAALLWAGMVIGVSGLATPAKFSAQSLSLPVALDVGRVTFHLFSRIEWGLAAILILAALTANLPCLLLLPIGFVAVVVALQAIWLLPALDAAVAITITGGTPPASAHHIWYIVTEAAKLVALLAIGLGAMVWRDRTGIVHPG